MTVKQFASKYGITYGYAWKCTYGLHPYHEKNGYMDCNQYNESDMFSNLIGILQEKKQKALCDAAKCDEKCMMFTQLYMKARKVKE